MIEESGYWQLRKEIDERMPVGMPASEGHWEIKLPKQFFAPEGAAVATPECPSRALKKIYKRVKKP